jgi:hypothetical protein
VTDDKKHTFNIINLFFVGVGVIKYKKNSKKMDFSKKFFKKSSQMT